MQSVTCLLLVWLQVSPAVGVTDAATGVTPVVRESGLAESREPVPKLGQDQPVSVWRVNFDQLKERLAEGAWLPVPPEFLQQISGLSKGSPLPAGITDPPRIRAVRYRAVLDQRRLVQGTLELELATPDVDQPVEPLPLGQTNLQQLVIRDGADTAAIGADRERRLFLLNPGTTRNWQGSWSADGTVTGDFVTFRLELPPAITSQLVLTTPAQVQISSSNGLVLGPEPEGEQLRWTIFPNVASRLTLTCRTRRVAASGSAFSLAGLAAVHTVTGDLMTSRWTISLPSELQGINVFVADLPVAARIVDVLFNDNQPLEWTTSLHDATQQVRMVLPAGQVPTAISVLTVSVLPQSDSWTLPLLTPRSWERQGQPDSGAILLPASIVSLTVPPGIDLDGWTLTGLQERDVIAGPDNSRTFQLMRFGRDASAVAHISTSQARISDSVVTILEASGRLATARCLINVRCEQASVVELAWPVSQGWEAIAVRYASNSRSLFFEFSRPDVVNEQSRLIVHLPESLEPQSSRVFEVQFRQTELADVILPQLPIPVRTAVPRQQADVLIVAPSAQQSQGSGRLWRHRTQLLSESDFQQQYSWVPKRSAIPDSVMYLVSGQEDGGVEPVSPESRSDTEQAVAVSWLATIDRDMLVETSRFVIPEENLTGKVLEFLLPTPNETAGRADITSDSADLAWTVNDEVVTSAMVTADPSIAGAQRHSLTLSRPVEPESDVVVVCERRRQISVPSRFAATLLFPVNAGSVSGQMQVVCPEQLNVTVDGQVEMSVAAGTTPQDSWQSRVFRFPETPQLVSMAVDRVQTIHQGEAIDTHVFHVVEQGDRQLNQQVLALARIGRQGESGSIPLSVPAHVRPVAFINGSRVQLITDGDRLSLPLPVAEEDCRVILIWKEPVPETFLMTTQLPLSAVFLPDHPSEQTTHHLLVAPTLEIVSPGVSWAASVPTDTHGMLDGSVNRLSDMVSAEISGTPSDATAPRSFATRWELASAQGWQHRTLATSGADLDAISIQVNSLTVRRTLQYAAMIVSLTASAVMLPLLARRRRLVAAMALSLAAGRLFVMSFAVDAVLNGLFWGVFAGFVLTLVLRWPRGVLWPAPAGRAVTVSVLMAVAFQASVHAQGLGEGQDPPRESLAEPAVELPRQNPADVLVLENAAPGEGLVFVRESLFQRWQASHRQSMARQPQVVVTSQQVRIVAHAEDSVEQVLSMGVAVVTSERESVLTLPLQMAQLVECTIDGRTVLPMAGADNSILIPVPASVLVPVRRLLSIPPSSGNPLDLAWPQRVGPNAATVEAGPLLTWDIHQIECRLRPQIVRQANGMQFRLPILPCAAASVEVDCPSAFVKRAFVKTGAGVLQWTPADGAVPLSSVPLTGGLDVRLFSSDEVVDESGQPVVQTLTVCEMSAGQQLLTTVCRMSRWNPLVHNLQLQVPRGYRLVAVSSSRVAELFWSVRDGLADVQLNDLNTSEFDLELRLLCELPTEPLQHDVRVAELVRIAGCTAAPTSLVAVRTTPEFAVRQTEPVNGSGGLPVTEVPASFAAWVRRSDVLFQVPSSTPRLLLELSPRSAYSEVRVMQSVECGETVMTWTWDADIETAVLNLFRHRMTVDPAIEITDVQVFVGEANRLDRWHRRGDQLMILLKEGTSGLYRLSIRGKQPLAATETDVRLVCPQLQDIPILESSLTVIDNSESGYLVAETGSAVPDRRLQDNQYLPAGMPLRFQVVDESEPLMLRRRRFAPLDASLAVIRQSDRAIVLLQIEEFPTVVDADRMTFAADVVFLEPPRVTLGGQLRNTVRTANEFRWIAADGKEDAATLMACWIVPLSADSGNSLSSGQQSLLALPGFAFPLNWKQTLIADHTVATSDSQGNLPGARNETSDDSVAELLSESADQDWQSSGPGWVTVALKAFDVADLPWPGQFEPLNISSSPAADTAVLPAPVGAASPATAVRTRPIVVADTAVVAAHQQSAVAETTLVVFAPQTATRLTMSVPPQTIITRIDSRQPIRWDNADRSRLTIDLTEPVTQIRLRWLSQRASGTMFMTRLHLAPPVPVGCQVGHLLSIRSTDPGALHMTASVPLLNGREFDQRLFDVLNQGFDQLQNGRTRDENDGSASDRVPPGSMSGTETASSSDSQIRELRIQEIMSTLEKARSEFFPAAGLAAVAVNSQRMDIRESVWLISAEDPGSLQLSIRRLPSLSTILPWVLALAMLVAAFLGAPAVAVHAAPDATLSPAEVPGSASQVLKRDGRTRAEPTAGTRPSGSAVLPSTTNIAPMSSSGSSATTADPHGI